ncbi:hypothetical protein GCM10020001_051440 [Nonomuraea salmonea]
MQAHAEGQPGAVAVGGDDHRAAELPAVLGGDADDVAAAVVEDRACDGDALHQAYAVLDRVGGDDLVEVLPGADEPEVREALELRPVELEAQAAADDAQALVPDPAGRVDVDAHVLELLDGARGQAVAADLLAGEPGLLQEQHVEAVLREVPGGGGAGGAGADDDDIGIAHDRARFTAR